MANKKLKVDVVVNAKTRQLDTMMMKLDKVANQTNRLAAANNKLKATSENVTKQHKKEADAASFLISKLKKLASAYLGVMAARTAVTSSDTITKAENKLNYLNATNLGSTGYATDSNGAKVYSEATLNATQETMDKMYTSSQKVRMGYADMMTNVSKSMTLAGEAFGGNIDNAIRFQEIMAESYALSGSSAQEMHSSMYQMIQGLGSGILQGDELRSVREGASLAYQVIEEYAQSIYGAEENLKDLAAQGKITADIVTTAILNNGQKIDDAFAMTKVTFEQAWTGIKNTALQAFSPVLKQMNDLLNSENGKAFINIITEVIMVVARVATVLFTVFSAVFNWFVENWNWVKWIVLSVIIIITDALVVLAAQLLATALKAFIAFLAPLAPLYVWILIIGAIIALFAYLGVSFQEVCGFIVGVLLGALATVWNIIAGVVNAIIQFLWTVFVERFIGIIEWVLNVANGGFNSFGDRVKNLLGQIISWFLSLGKVVTKIIDAIFGTNWTSGLNSLQDKVLQWGKNETAITLNRDAPELKRASVTDAYNEGFGYGTQLGNWVTDKLNVFGSLPNVGLDTTDIPALDNIDSNTGKIADSVELAEEDLAYLRDLAHMEWKKEFTTASITVDMSNYNTISGENDLDGIVTKLADKLYEEMNVVANGVYA